MTPKLLLTLGGLYGLLGVLLGAFGAHGLRDRLEPSQLDSWQTAVQYQLFHAIALIIVMVWFLHTEQMRCDTLGAYLQ
ncbi:MAG: hypothetical protein CM15mP120_07630 [Pseudomonadota bacterium]|nr:MAG: hypothetical protein CM15mP120_07630 [Pseudomonadota bacterium]